MFPLLTFDGCIVFLQEARNREANRISRKRKNRLQAKATVTSNEVEEGIEEDNEGDEEVIVDDDLAPPKKKIYNAQCWNHFQKPKKFPNGVKYVVCELCPKELKLKYSGGTSNLIKHLRCRHKGEYRQDLATGENIQVGDVSVPTVIKAEVSHVPL